VLIKDIAKNSVPCDICSPDRSTDFVFPEKHRYWAQVSDEASAVLDALYKYDDNGARYLTNVAQRLLEVSSSKDSGIDSIYRIEVIP
jgi:predicted metal-dependent hydrolase